MNINVSSPIGISGALGTNSCPFSLKKSINPLLICFDVSNLKLPEIILQLPLLIHTFDGEYLLFYLLGEFFVLAEKIFGVLSALSQPHVAVV